MFITMNKTDFGLWVRSEREKKNWSQAELARESGLYRSLINNIEGGVSESAPKTLKALAHGLKLDPEIVFRAAGILPPTVEADQTLTQIAHLYNTLKDPENKQRALDYFELLIRQEEKGSNNARQQNLQPKPR